MLHCLSGGCLCGAVRYMTSAAPVFAGNCHCRDCQKSGGGAYAPTFTVPDNVVAISGEVKYYQTRGDSGNLIERGFCPNCGSQLFSKLGLLPGLVSIRAGSLDDPAEFTPTLDFFTSSAPHWDRMNPDLPKFPKAPMPR